MTWNTQPPQPYQRVLAIWQSKSSPFRFVTESYFDGENWHSVSNDLRVTSDLYVTFWCDMPEMTENNEYPG